MTKDNIEKTVREINGMLDSGNLADPIMILRDICRKKGDHKLSEQINSISETYKYLSDYMIQGIDDPTRGDIISDLSEQLRTIADAIVQDIVTVDSSDSYSENVRFQKIRPSDIESLLANYSSATSELSLAKAAGNDIKSIELRIEDTLQSIFNTIWTSFNDRKLIKRVSEAVTSEKYGYQFAAQAISAMILSLTAYFDRFKLLALIDIYEAELSERISARALVGIVLALSFHGNRAYKIKEIRQRLENMQDSLIAYSRLREVVIAIIRTRDTDRVSTKMKEEVLPELMKLQPDILRRMREAGSDPEKISSENNPEWEEILEKSGLSEKMRELSEMQTEGADLMMVAFSNLKQFPFFNNVSNWFLPFTTDHSVVTENEHDKEILENMMQIGAAVCDTDKYSLAIAMAKMPDAQKNMMFSQLDAQMSQMNEQLKDLQLKKSSPEFNEEVGKVIKDLYRFFKLYRKKDGFNDPFAKPFNFMDLPVVGEMLADSDILTLVAEFYFKRGYYEDALGLFNILLQNELDEETKDETSLATLWEKVGYCYQSLKFYEEALSAYSKAELLKKPSKWLVKTLANINKRLRNYAKSLEYYKILLDSDPENVTYLTNAGFTAMESGNLEEAAGFYYHVNYLKPDDNKLLRAIAWCEFLRRDYDKSLKYYNKVILDAETPADNLNIGHVYLMQGKIGDAYGCYRKAYTADPENFERSFKEDYETLTSLGLDITIPKILLDKLKLNK